MSLLLTDNASPGLSDGMMPGFLVAEGRGHLALSQPLLDPLVIYRRARHAPVLFEEQLATSLGSVHGVDEQAGEYDERRARHEVNEDDAEPVVDVEVDLRVTLDERHQADAARRHRLPRRRRRTHARTLLALPRHRLNTRTPVHGKW